MGRIDVKMKVHKDGHVSAHMMADKQDTLDLLQRDQRALQTWVDRALAAGKPSLLNIRVRSQISPRAQGVVDSRKQGGAF